MNIKYVIVKNEMPASATEAKYLGRIIPNGVRNRALMTENILATEHFAEATLNAVIDAAITLTEELCAEGRDVDWGPVKFLSKMHGSLPCEDSAFTDGTASLTLDADATNTARAALAELTPTKASAAEMASLIKVSNVMDVATEQFGTVIGSTQFVILGNGLTLDAEGEYAKALDKKTGAVKGTATVQSVSKGQRAYAKFSPQLAGGDYTLEVATKGLIGEATPRVFHKPITAIASSLPQVTITSFTYNADVEQYDLFGTNLDAVTGYNVGEVATTFTGRLIYSGGTSETVEVGKAAGMGPEIAFAIVPSRPLAAGETATIELTPNPARTDIDQTKATASVTRS